MLNPFPIQFLSLFAYFLLRIIVGGVLFVLGVKHLRKPASLGVGMKRGIVIATIELLISGLFILGAYTQYAALALMFFAIAIIVFHKRLKAGTIPGRMFYVLLFGTALSLFITGAGAFAFDLPI